MSLAVITNRVSLTGYKSRALDNYRRFDEAAYTKITP